MYDYLLVAGPGRSGSEFLYRALRDHPSFVFPEIKERSYYRSPKALARAWGRLDAGKRQVLCDIANDAYADPKLPERVEALRGEGFRVLLVTLLRDHRERAVSMMQFRRSRGEESALFGAGRLERAAVRDRLTGERLDAIFRTNVDVLTLSFPALTRETRAVLDALASLCEVERFDDVPQQAVNESVHARHLWLSAAGHWCALVLRRLGFRRLLQRLKESGLAGRVFFRPPPPGAERPSLSEGAVNALDASALECSSIVESSSEQLSEGVYFRKADGAVSPPVEYAAVQQRNFGALVRAGRFGVGFRHKPAPQAFVRECIAKALPPAAESDLSILDCGCGSGAWLEFIMDELSGRAGALRCCGFDITEEMVETARRRLPGLPPHRLRQGDILDTESYIFDGEPPKFDLIFCYDVVQQLPRDLQLSACETAAAHLAQGGVAVIFDNERDSLFGRGMGFAKLLRRYLRIPVVPAYFTAARYPPMRRFARQLRERGYETAIEVAPNRRKWALVVRRPSAA